MLLRYLCVVFICATKNASFGVIFGAELKKNINTYNLNGTWPGGPQNNNNTASSDLTSVKPLPALRLPGTKSSSDTISKSQKEDHKKEHRSKEDNMKKNERKKSFGKKTSIGTTEKGNSNTDEITNNKNNPVRADYYFPYQQAQAASETIPIDITQTTDALESETSLILSNIQNKTTTDLPVVNKTESSTKNYPTVKQNPKNNVTNYNGQYEDPGEANKEKFMEASTNSTQNKEAGKENTKNILHDPAAETLPGFNSTGSYLASNEKGKAKLPITNDNHISAKSSEKFASTTTNDTEKDDSSTRNGVVVFIISLIVIAAFVYTGFIKWKKLILSHYRGEILINEEEFCEDCTDAHQFEMDQQQNTNVIRRYFKHLR